MPFAATTPPRLATLVLLTAISVVTLNMFVPSLVRMADSFGVAYPVMALAVSGYLGTTGVVTLVVGPLSDRFGRRPILLVALAVFTVASLACATATDIRVFLVFRILQGAVIAGWAVSLAIIGDTSPPRQAASRIGYLTTAMAIAPMLAPSLGGVLDEAFGWRATFLALAGVGAVALVLCWADVAETNTVRSATMTAQFRTYPSLLRSRRYWGFALCMAFSTGSFYLFLAGAPHVAVAVLELSPSLLGLGMGLMTTGFAAGSLLAGRYAARFPLVATMIAGRLVATAGLLAGVALFAVGFAHPVSLFGPAVLAGLGNGLTMPGSNAGALAVRPDLAGSAAGLAGALTVTGGGLLTAIGGTLAGAEGGALPLFAAMLFCTLAALAAALDVRRLDLRDNGLADGS